MNLQTLIDGGAYATLYQLQLLEGRKAERRMVPS